MRWKLSMQEKKLDALFKTVASIQDEELKAILSKFLCVRTSGFIESSLKNLISEYCYGSSPKNIEQFVNRRIKVISNLKYDRILEVLAMFCDDWKDEFSNRISDEQKAALNSIVSNRNNISHGENDSMSYEIMKDYFAHAKDVVEILKDIIKK